MKKIKGIPVSEGVALGISTVIEKDKLTIDRKSILPEEIESELERFEYDANFVIHEIEHLIENYTFNQEHKDILITQKMILQDPEFHKSVTQQITNNLSSLEHAISNYFTEITKIFSNMDNEFFAQRVSDYEDVAYRLLSRTLKQGEHILSELNEKSILIMKNITPSFVTKVFEKHVRGLVTEKGSRNSHSSIIARSMGLPMIAGVREIIENIPHGRKIIIDGNNGEIIIDPTNTVQKKFEAIFEKEQENRHKLDALIDVKSITADGKVVKLMSNIEIPDELNQVVKFHSEGIGLFRTEFLFIDKNKLPTEEEQYQIYKEIAEKISPEPLVIRTIDVGGDKLSSILNLGREENPNLGCRGIRISFENIQIFKQQFRAILRAYTKEYIRIMFPMISDVKEIVRAKKIIAQCMDQLTSKGIEFGNKLEIGAMIEIPSAVFTSDAIARACDFLSIGTNDLVQYTLAVDRDNESVSTYYKPSHPSVIRSIKMTVENAHKYGKRVAVCGEMASEIKYVKLLLGLGVDELSVSPGRLLKVKNEILKCDFQQAEKLAELALQLDSSEEISNLLI
ncbi:MAG: phosphoenolpyruvate--protein phosphotransferase [Candidatus Cloacimonadales bacterium]|nr:phosphoenolpyruvate--protein phosphotransferase [Candidatus Cloacimonadales bacterium]